jgi:hypothetical protein
VTDDRAYAPSRNDDNTSIPMTFRFTVSPCRANHLRESMSTRRFGGLL